MKLSYLVLYFEQSKNIKSYVDLRKLRKLEDDNYNLLGKAIYTMTKGIKESGLHYTKTSLCEMLDENKITKRTKDMTEECKRLIIKNKLKS